MDQQDTEEKPLVKILGRELVLRVADICEKVVGIKNLFIATDSSKSVKLQRNMVINI